MTFDRDNPLNIITMTVSEFLAQTKKKCEATAKRMARIELAAWNEDVEKSLMGPDWGMTKKQVADRKLELQRIVNS